MIQKLLQLVPKFGFVFQHSCRGRDDAVEEYLGGGMVRERPNEGCHMGLGKEADVVGDEDDMIRCEEVGKDSSEIFICLTIELDFSAMTSGRRIDIP